MMHKYKPCYSIFEAISSWKYKRKDTGFPYSGLLVFCGVQGSGKTYSMVQYALQVKAKYPKCKVISNVHINNMDYIVYDGIKSIRENANGEDGILVLIDEMHLEFNSLESREIGISVFVEISQQRKQRVHIIGTSQVYMRLAKAFREQMKYVVLCKCFFRCVQWNKVIDGEESEEIDGKLNAKVINRYIDFHKVSGYKAYDTYQKIERVLKIQDSIK
ncbi:MAG: ATP-binding protein [Sulfolobaceae archaeon]